jgi:hypothetical protein
MIKAIIVSLCFLLFKSKTFYAEEPIKRALIKGQHTVLIETEECAADLGNCLGCGKPTVPGF